MSDRAAATILSFDDLNATSCYASLLLIHELGIAINTLENKGPTANFYPYRYFSFCGGSGSGAISAWMRPMLSCRLIMQYSMVSNLHRLLPFAVTKRMRCPFQQGLCLQ